MSRRRENKQFRVGKNYPKTDKVISPLKGEPNSNLDTYNKSDGKFHSRRKFGSSGHAVKDYDVSDNHKQYEHVHDFESTNRCKDRRPTKQEQREIDKAKKKRRFW